ncbi:butyrophilin subfamily 1 member A1-like [Sarcoramphus papa]
MWFPASPRDLLSYFMTLHVLQLGSADFRVVGPGHPLHATVGQDVVLPCRLSPRMDAWSLEIRWIRHQFSETVHHYRNGEDWYAEQMEEYAGRTELARGSLSSGSLDLRIMMLRPSDDGQYVCTAKDAGSYAEATVDLEVAATGSVPHLSLEAYKDKSIRVGCRSAGWYPQPEVLWKDPSGQHLPSVSQKHSSDERGLFDIEDVIVVTGNRHGKWSCVVRNSRLNQELESSLHISGATIAASPCGAGGRAGGRCLASSSFDLGGGGGREGLALVFPWDREDYVPLSPGLPGQAAFFHNVNPWVVTLGVFLVLSIGLSAYLFRRKGKFVMEGIGVEGGRALAHGLMQSRELGESFWPLPPAKPPDKGALLGGTWGTGEHWGWELGTGHVLSYGKKQGSMWGADTKLQYSVSLEPAEPPDLCLESGLTPECPGVWGLPKLCLLLQEQLWDERERDAALTVGCDQAARDPSLGAGGSLPTPPAEGVWGLPKLCLLLQEQLWDERERDAELTVGCDQAARDPSLGAGGSLPTPPAEGVWGLPKLCLLLQEQLWDEKLSPPIKHYFCFCFAEERDAALRWKKFLLPQNRDVVTLDPDTAHPRLVLSADGRSARWESAQQDLPDTPERFSGWCCVLGREGFTEGKHCWEVEVEGKVGGDAWWAVGVARGSVERKGYTCLSPEGGIWAVCHLNGKFLSLTSPRTPLPQSLLPRRIWVSLDCAQGLVTFVNADREVEIFTFPLALFNGESIHPWFLVGTEGTQLCLSGSTS